LTVTPSQLDAILELQLGVAWAGEARTEPPRLSWWQTAMVDEFAGADLLRRLTPRTWEWAALETCRAAASKVDREARAGADDPDHLVSLYRLGFELDERLDERLLELKQGETAPAEALPRLAQLLREWSRERFESWLAECGAASYTTTATGRRLKGEMPADTSEAARQLVAALLPLAESYSLPHFRLRR
jgi:hypothetical protein